LTVPEWAYRRMVEGSGQPNRRRVNYYRDVARRLGFSCQIYVTYVLGVEREFIPAKTQLQLGMDYPDSSVEMIRAIRPRFSVQFRELSDTDLLVQGIFLVARKPGP